jgi:membrane dipeptidase
MARTPIALVRQVGRVPTSTVTLDREEERRFEQLMESIIMLDIHQHPMVLPEDLTGELRNYLRSGQYQWGYEAARAGGWTAVATCNLLRGIVASEDISFPDFEAVVEEIGMMLADIAGSREKVIKVTSADDIERAKQSQTVGFLPTVEQLAIGYRLEGIDLLWGLGIRIAGLTYSRANYIGDGQLEPRDAGLSVFGRAVVDRMNDLGMAIDLSHAGEQTALDAIEHSKAPVIFSHNAAHAVWPTRRTRKDRDFIACVRKGGLIGVTAVPNALSDDPDQDINCVLDHFDYLVRLVGEDHVAIGTDTMIGDHVGFHTAAMGRDAASEDPPAKYLDGLESPADGKNIIRGLIKRGYSNAQIEKIAGHNALSFLRRVMS